MVMDMFLRLDGIPGESKDEKHRGEIDVLAWSWGMSNSGATHVTQFPSGKPALQDISYTSYIDASATSLMLASARGSHIRSAVLTIRRLGGDLGPADYVVTTLSDVFVSSYSTGGSGGEDRLTANVTLNFGDITVAYTPPADAGPVMSKPFHYNVVTNKS